MTHDLKIAPKWFDTVLSGVKSFEVRKDDRPYKPNDVLILREFDGTTYTGRVCKVDVRFVLRGEYCRDRILHHGHQGQRRRSLMSSTRFLAPMCRDCDYCIRRYMSARDVICLHVPPPVFPPEDGEQPACAWFKPKESQTEMSRKGGKDK